MTYAGAWNLRPRRNARPAFTVEREQKNESIPYTPDHYVVVTDADYPVPVAWVNNELVYK